MIVVDVPHSHAVSQVVDMSFRGEFLVRKHMPKNNIIQQTLLTTLYHIMDLPLIITVIKFSYAAYIYDDVIILLIHHNDSCML